MQTSIEWLQQKYDNCPESFLTDEDFEQAKEMHKQEIMNAVNEGIYQGYNDYIDTESGRLWDEYNPEQYYQDTFKKD